MMLEYKKHYLRGWKASQGYRGGLNSPLERADSRGEHKAWYDGYHDHAGDYPKYHAMTCPGPSKCPEHEEYYL